MYSRKDKPIVQNSLKSKWYRILRSNYNSMYKLDNTNFIQDLIVVRFIRLYVLLKKLHILKPTVEFALADCFVSFFYDSGESIRSSN